VRCRKKVAAAGCCCRAACCSTLNAFRAGTWPLAAPLLLPADAPVVGVGWCPGTSGAPCCCAVPAFAGGLTATGVAAALAAAAAAAAACGRRGVEGGNRARLPRPMAAAGDGVTACKPSV
jgi:hypothetical protein